MVAGKVDNVIYFVTYFYGPISTIVSGVLRLVGLVLRSSVSLLLGFSAIAYKGPFVCTGYCYKFAQ